MVFNGGTYLLAWVNNTELSGATKDIVGVLIDTNIAGPNGLSETQPVGVSPQPLAPGDLTVWVNSPLDPGSAFLPQSVINEPSVAQSGGNVFYTGNWYAAAASTANPGPADWFYVDPFNDPAVGMPDFCCDQDVIADRGRDIIMWYRQGLFNFFGDLQGRFTLGVSSDGGGTFCTYSTRPVDVNGNFVNRWFDFPHLALSDNYLYISTNVVFDNSPFTERKLVLRWPLDALQNCAGFGYSYTDSGLGPQFPSTWGEPVQGATTTMYIGDHRGTNNTFWVYSWPENGGVSNVSRAIPAFPFENGNGSCPVAGTNPCARADSRIQAGWVRKGKYQTVGEVGFMWNASQGVASGFPFPYIEAVTFREDNLTVVGRPLVWNPGITFHYPFVSPNTRGDLGLTLTQMGNGNFPATIFSIDDDYNGPPPGWQIIGLRFGNGSANAWGDYVRNRAFLPSETGWVSTGHTIVNGAVEPRFYVISRGRDGRSINRYLNTP